MKFLILTWILLTFSIMCWAGDALRACWTIRLSNVICKEECGFVQGITEERFTDLDGVECMRYRYVDDVVNITWYISDIALNYSFINKTDSLMVLDTGHIFGHDWESHPVSYGSTMEKPRFYPQLTIPAHTFCTGYLIPMYNYPDAKHPEADLLPFLPNTFGSERAARREARRWEDKEYTLRFPLIVGDTSFNYLFTFVLDGISALIPRMAEEQPQPAVATVKPVEEPSLMAQYAGRESYPTQGRRSQGFALSFCPEGGHLIAGVTCRVAFCAVIKGGSPAEIESMKDDDGNDISILYQHDGVGCFNIKVADARSHRVTVRSGGKEYLFPLPKAETRGCALRVDEATRPGYLNITVTARRTDADSLFTYTLTQQESVYAADTLCLATPPEPVGGVSLAFERITLPMDALPIGNSLFTLRNISGKVMARRLIFIPPLSDTLKGNDRDK